MSAASARHGRTISVTGLGYVGLPVAAAFARSGVPVIAYDIDEERIGELREGQDRTRSVEAEDLAAPTLILTSEAPALAGADFHIVTVPTPVDKHRRPDLGHLHAASRTLGRHLKRGDIVVYESTVYPGVTEEECVPKLEETSGLKWKTDFHVGYSPERINPGDRERRFETILKIVAADSPETLALVDRVYRSVVTAGTYLAPSIKVAEAAKAVENTQRDLNIALMNELALIFDRLGIDTRDVLDAAGTKWNFLKFHPGLVGGHCTGIDPFYLTHVAESVGYPAQVIQAGRRTNDEMGFHVARQVVRNVMQTKSTDGSPVVTVLGATFKGDVPDVRNTRVCDIIRELENFGIRPQVHDPLADAAELKRDYGVALLPLDKLEPAHALVIAVRHSAFVQGGWPLALRLLHPGPGFIADLFGILDRQQKPDRITLWRL
jgi:UDP-N-acetyl-D-galactosamine dehydrogenase